MGRPRANPHTMHAVECPDIQALLIRTGMTQSVFARAYGFSREAVHSWLTRPTTVVPLRCYLQAIDRDPKGIAAHLAKIAGLSSPPQEHPATRYTPGVPMRRKPPLAPSAERAELDELLDGL